jgi:hypothetical protein
MYEAMKRRCNCRSPRLYPSCRIPAYPGVAGRQSNTRRHIDSHIKSERLGEETAGEPCWLPPRGRRGGLYNGGAGSGSSAAVLWFGPPNAPICGNMVVCGEAIVNPINMGGGRKPSQTSLTPIRDLLYREGEGNEKARHRCRGFLLTTAAPPFRPSGVSSTLRDGSHPKAADEQSGDLARVAQSRQDLRNRRPI